MVVTHNRRRVYPYAKPASLNFRAGQFYTLKAWPRALHDQLVAERGSGSFLLDDPNASPEPGTTSPPAAVGEEDGAAEADRSDEDGPREGYLRLTLKEAGGRRELGVQVKPTKLAGKVLEHWCRQFGVDAVAQARMWLECEGERIELDRGIGECDEVEDEVQVDVVGPK